MSLKHPGSASMASLREIEVTINSTRGIRTINSVTIESNSKLTLNHQTLCFRNASLTPRVPNRDHFVTKPETTLVDQQLRSYNYSSRRNPSQNCGHHSWWIVHAP
ncbi:hypothetical protein IGI04_030093 [Brassica rapa subsp. trilocularis]|uniref:Uncharacterized protein n=1 Tax=Brassica rapa subsp. trilocularis TaxID=1813537 RepID=A0ABQ7LPT1_BRACM|nr:hypothetical protein IGI04_030093 [Brassica rapa subsp. trilocularis]